jgi:glycosyltransferase involved in cell wall biosynthesis
MKIAIASTGRFWLLDLARELVSLGHEVEFYSYVPRRRAERFGLDRKHLVSLLPWVFPLVALSLRGPRFQRRFATDMLILAMDWLVALKLNACDVFVGISGTYVKAALAARTRYGARVIVERGSRHILSQKEILDDLAARGVRVETVPAGVERRELRMYHEADLIVVPAKHVEQSFIEKGVPSSKIFRNPFGVALRDFQPTLAPSTETPTAIFVGTWSYRKGVDLLVEAWKSLPGFRLMHVGPQGDAPYPEADWFRHIDPVDQSRLADYYAQAHLFVLASREEGLSLVIPQAVSCGLPVVCTDRTGGGDLKRLLVDPGMMTEVPAGDVDAFAKAVATLMPMALGLRGVRDLLAGVREELSWTAYGKRYEAMLTFNSR